VELVAAGWLARLLPSVDFEKPLPEVDLGDLVIIPDDISALVAPGADLRMVVKSAPGCATWRPMPSRRRPAGLQRLRVGRPRRDPAGRRRCRRPAPAGRPGASIGQPTERRPLRSYRVSRATGPRPIHPGDDGWRGGCRLALDALEAAGHHRHRVERLSPVETTNVQLPTGDRLQIPTGAETLRLKGYLIMCATAVRTTQNSPISSTAWTPRPPQLCSRNRPVLRF
jgi:RND superfamily putative drug exporter